ncbi:MAG TPA: hypothetical protein VFO16_22515, partial [Pseudonocardiaceae bacterium]|nr:hypothetical protein [Pseudonocardiaceae bacterium]
QAAPGQPRHGHGEAAAVAAAVAGTGVPIAAPAAAAAIRRAGVAGSGSKPSIGQAAEAHPARSPGMVEGHVGGAGRAGAGHTAGFGPRPASAAAEVAEAQMGSLARGAGIAAAERAGSGGMIPPMGAAVGKRGEDTEHRRPAYLIEMNDVFADGRLVAPAVIGEDSPKQGGPGQGGPS